MMKYNFRTLNYLGSKLRLLDFIEGNVLNVTKEGEGVCDLFAAFPINCQTSSVLLHVIFRHTPG